MALCPPDVAAKRVPDYAISIKQPWATLIVHGLKTVEVRRWPTARRGRILIHAAGICDDRPEGWRQLPENLHETAQLTRGILGAAVLVQCVTYRSQDEFDRDLPRHLNESDWFEPPRLFGFAFTNPIVLPFRSYPGWMRFFPVGDGPFK